VVHPVALAGQTWRVSSTRSSIQHARLKGVHERRNIHGVGVARALRQGPPRCRGAAASALRLRPRGDNGRELHADVTCKLDRGLQSANRPHSAAPFADALGVARLPPSCSCLPDGSFIPLIRATRGTDVGPQRAHARVLHSGRGARPGARRRWRRDRPVPDRWLPALVTTSYGLALSAKSPWSPECLCSWP
jgi:hypothetical protein